MTEGRRDTAFVAVGSRALIMPRGAGVTAFSGMDLELTERCNNACAHCYINLPASDTAARARELPTDRWKDLIEQAASLGVLSVRLTGGEPLLRDDFAEIYLHARHQGMVVVLYTNACLITPELADLFVEVPTVGGISVSVYGMSPATYEAVTRVKGSYAAFRRGIDLLLERSVPFSVKGALMAANRHEVAVFEEWAAQLPGQERWPGYASFFDFRCRHDSVEKNRLIESLRATPEEAIELLARHGDEYRAGMKGFAARFMGPMGDCVFSCGAGCGGCVDAYGILQACMLVRHPDLVFDLVRGSLADGLREIGEKVRSLKASDPTYLARCANCFLGGLCEQCPGHSWNEHGTFDTPVEYFCAIAHARARFVGLLDDGEQAWEVEDADERMERL